MLEAVMDNADNIGIIGYSSTAAAVIGAIHAAE